MSSDDAAAAVPRNHPLAPRMATIAFLHHNIAIAGIWGTFSILLAPVEAHLGIGRELSTLAIPAVNLANAVFALIIGAMATKVSLRLLMLAGAALSTAGFALLAVPASFPLYLLAYGLLLGPGMAAGAVLPGVLVTRGYQPGRGRALGIAYAPVIVTFTPLVAAWVLQAHGLPATYAALTALSAIAFVASLFVIDNPPGRPAEAAPFEDLRPAPIGGVTIADLLRSPLFWGLTLAYMAAISGAIILTAHMSPIALAWGFSADQAAGLLAVQAFCGIPGAMALGWLADRLGGVRTSIIVAFNCAALWLLLLLRLPYPGTMVLVGLIGVNAAGAVPVLSVTLSQKFGAEAFSRAFGLINMINLPVAIIAVPAAAVVYAHTRSYSGAMIGQAAFFALAGLILFAVQQTPAFRRQAQAVS